MNRRQAAALREKNYYEREWSLFEARERATRSRAEIREAYGKLSAHHILRLADQLGVKAPKDKYERERFNFDKAVRKALGI